MGRILVGSVRSQGRIWMRRALGLEFRMVGVIVGCGPGGVPGRKSSPRRCLVSQRLRLLELMAKVASSSWRDMPCATAATTRS